MLNNEERVPFFSFEEVEVGEDKEASLEKGYAVPKLETYIKVLPHGHKDTIDFEVHGFLARKHREAEAGNYPKPWVQEFSSRFEAYKAGRDLPRSGIPVLTWGKLLKKDREALALRYPTVEDVAAVPDSGLTLLGLEGRIIRDKAREEIAGLNPLKAELGKAEETIKTQAELIAKMEERLAALENPVEEKKVTKAKKVVVEA